MRLSDILQKVKAIFIIDRSTGILEYHEQLEDDGLDPTLVSGLFAAIEGFASSIFKDERIESFSFARKKFVFEIMGPYLLVLHIDESLSDEDAKVLIQEIIKRYNVILDLDEDSAKSLFLDQGRAITIDLIKQIREIKKKTEKGEEPVIIKDMVVLDPHFSFGKKLLIDKAARTILQSHDKIYALILMIPREKTNGILFYWKENFTIPSLEEFILDLIDSLNKSLQVHQELGVKYTPFQEKDLVLHNFTAIKDGGGAFLVESDLELYYFNPFLRRAIQSIENIILHSP